MNKDSNRSAAGLRRSAIAERIRLREEWSALKGTDNATTSKKKTTVTSILAKKRIATKKTVLTNSQKNEDTAIENFEKEMKATSEVLHGVVALVEVGNEKKALALRAALTALGATVVPTWSPIVTHLVWAQGGCRRARSRGRALASQLVSPLWVEACAAAGARLPARGFPAAARASDLPSPRTLRVLLKKADMENVPIADLLSESEERELKPARLRLSSETERDTSADTSRDTSKNTTKSSDTSKDATDVESRVNTAPRRAMPKSMSTPRPRKSKRKLFTQRDADLTKDSESDNEPTLAGPKRVNAPKLTQKDRRDLARAERIARRLVAGCTPVATQKVAVKSLKPRIILTGMDRTERHTVCEAIRKLDGHVQTSVNKRTTHVLLGSFRANNVQCSGLSVMNKQEKSLTSDSAPVNNDHNTSVRINNRVIDRLGKNARTFNALAGAARGARVLYAQWALDSLEAKQWLHHYGYEVPHLKKISLKARVERTALGKCHSEYAYDIFSGMRVLLKSTAEQRDAAKQLLELCGAVVQDGGHAQNGGSFDITIGAGNGEVSSKWVFDSVASARMRTIRRYVVSGVGGRDVGTQETIR
ncbi:uncharacterized protein LOC113509304 [Galleria mellonella]|uniref:Uncharacterized protein LOC113509304 n=1 Tax=Galleria mellonella TaxID=7137 RepID=A0ABM3MZW2_GALME|nr:uncharacterized protein LOC113509304 [Galleria mellonella]XP_052756872.1 uncharacterized protein LOC113509304 [Galleria mellonella]XP_052756875.1 uncharacterized protein LOC113509304 [Galleria mellonella]XP_052756882.1 uncharacterized protein LOC113509304 [Galleria mellonella]XP_052756886.1 uncharacterized protein LOC113509304 [Galleria mellonella]